MAAMAACLEFGAAMTWVPSYGRLHPLPIDDKNLVRSVHIRNLILATRGYLSSLGLFSPLVSESQSKETSSERGNSAREVARGTDSYAWKLQQMVFLCLESS
jgi:hypothetical protein